MWQIAPEGKTIVNRLEIRGGPLDPVSSQQRLNFLLSHAGLHPTGLASSAILCVRHLPDPLPGTLRLEKAGELLPPTWEKAISGKLAQLVQQAARPALGPVVGGAEAVIFESWAELLACLAEDWCTGWLAARWWWKSLFGKMFSPELVISVWQDSPEYVPPALHLLAARGMAFTFIKKWRVASARLLLMRLVQSFGLHELGPVLNNFFAEDNANYNSESFGGKKQTGPFVADTIEKNLGLNGPNTLTPWQEVVSEIQTEDLTLTQASLLGIGLMLYRTPQKVRTSAFAQMVVEWANFRQASTRDSTNLKKSSNFATPSKLDAPHTPSSQSDYPIQAASLKPLSASPNLSFGPSEQVAEISTVKNSLIKPQIRFVPVRDLESQTEDAAISVEITPEASSKFELPKLPSRVIDTEFAGLFYLINLGLFLELYGDFTNPTRSGLELPIWDFLALVGERFLGERLRRDAVWEWLAKLAGRSEEEKPGQNFEPPGSWRLPPEWLKAFPERNWSWGTTNGRLRIKHPAGFLVLDVPLETEITPERQLARELENYAETGVRLSKRFFKTGNLYPAGSLECWLGWLLPYVKVRLGRALGMTPGRAGRLICQQPGQLRLSDSHLEIRLKLAQLPLQIRLAGLDRDPGWVPAAGRYIAFIFD